MSLLIGRAQLEVKPSLVGVTGKKAIIRLAVKNNLSVRVQAARATVFLIDSQGKVIGQSTRWIIDQYKRASGLPSGARGSFNFVITAIRPITSTNLDAKIQFNRVMLEGGTLGDIIRDVKIDK